MSVDWVVDVEAGVVVAVSEHRREGIGMLLARRCLFVRIDVNVHDHDYDHLAAASAQSGGASGFAASD